MLVDVRVVAAVDGVYVAGGGVQPEYGLVIAMGVRASVSPVKWSYCRDSVNAAERRLIQIDRFRQPRNLPGYHHDPRADPQRRKSMGTFVLATHEQSSLPRHEDPRRTR